MSRPYSGMGDAVCVRRTGALRGSWDKLLYTLEGFKEACFFIFPFFISIEKQQCQPLIDHQILLMICQGVCLEIKINQLHKVYDKSLRQLLLHLEMRFAIQKELVHPLINYHILPTTATVLTAKLKKNVQ